MREMTAKEPGGYCSVCGVLADYRIRIPFRRAHGHGLDQWETLVCYTCSLTASNNEGDKMQKSDDPHICLPTLDGNVHVIPVEVFDKIISGEMKITELDDWEIITRTIFSEWLKSLK